ncbi:MAG: arylmalonate decarboxylase [Alphaproteobacteria bacterium]
MKDTLGYRMKFGIIIPSTNTTVQPEMEAMRPAGVTNQIGRIPMENLGFDSDEDFEKIVRISSTVDEAAVTLMTCEVDHFIMGVAPDAFWEGENAGENLKSVIRQKTGLEMTVASDAMLAAFAAYGGIKRIAVVAPFTPDRDITAFYRANGYEVAGVVGMGATSAVNISQVSERRLREAVVALDAPDVDAIIQVGSNLPMARVAAEGERWLGKPVISANAATYWHALRSNGIMDRVRGQGRLLETM